ncbi:MAG: diacylglycerol O-acyltransferase / wax synthase [Frankiales bacterium]|nr:diacylglycerol O-acyltransferase / wax synthase [Frankiales bacterium]
MSPLEQLSGTDSALLALESPETPMQVLGVLVLDPTDSDSTYSFNRLCDVLVERIPHMPPFTRELVQVPLHLDRPYWQPVSDVDVAAHVNRITARPPGDWHVLADVVGDIASQLLPRDRPLWHLTVVEGLEDGRIALVARIHHATLYGATGVEFMAQLLDFDAEGRTMEPPPKQEKSAGPSQQELLARAALHAAAAPIRIGKVAAGSAGGLLGGVVKRVRGGMSGLKPDFGAPDTMLTGQLTANRSTAFTRVPLDDLKAVKDRHGGTVNDVVLTAVTGALREYFLKHGDDSGTRPLANCPMSVGGADIAGTDRITWLGINLPVDLAEPLDQLRAVSKETAGAKESTQAMGEGFIADVADATPALMLAGGGRLYSRLGLSRYHPPLCSLVVSNMMGPPVPLYLAGARIEAVFPLGPLLPQSGLNVTVLSDMGYLDIGLIACPDLVPDAWSIANGIVDAVARLRATVES